MIDTSPDNMKDTVLHKIFNAVNSKDRKSVSAVTHSMGNINYQLSLNHIIQESESTRDDIDKIIFDKLNNLENINLKRDESIYLGKYKIKQLSQIQAAKNALQESKLNDKDDIVNDFLQ